MTNNNTVEVRERYVWRVPMPTNTDIMVNKDINYRLLGAIMMESIRDSETGDNISRSITANTLKGTQLKELCSKNGLAVSTTKRHISALIKYLKDVEAIEIGTLTIRGITQNVYNIRFADKDGKSFVTVPSLTLKKLVSSYSSSVIKIFCMFLYMLRNNSTGKYITKHIPRSYIVDTVGVSKTVVSDNVEALRAGGFIKVNKVWEYDEFKGSQVSRNYYSLGDDVLNLIYRLDKGDKIVESIEEVVTTLGATPDPEKIVTANTYGKVKTPEELQAEQEAYYKALDERTKRELEIAEKYL